MSDFFDEAEPEKKKKYSLDLFDVLRALDKKDFKFYKKLTEEQQKEVNLITLLRWFTLVKGSNDAHAYYTTMANQHLNLQLYSLQSKNKELGFLVLCAIGIGSTLKHEWVKAVNKRPLTQLDKVILTQWPLLGNFELDIVKMDLNKEKFKEFLLDLGKTDHEIKDLMSKTFDKVVKK